MDDKQSAGDMIGAGVGVDMDTPIKDPCRIRRTVAQPDLGPKAVQGDVDKLWSIPQTLFQKFKGAKRVPDDMLYVGGMLFEMITEADVVLAQFHDIVFPDERTALQVGFGGDGDMFVNDPETTFEFVFMQEGMTVLMKEIMGVLPPS